MVTMKHMSLDQLRQNTVCGQAHAVLESLARSRSLPGELSITIEEILECAWEIAYRRSAESSMSNVIEVPRWAFPRAAS
jgi:hypothetical protein